MGRLGLVPSVFIELLAGDRLDNPIAGRESEIEGRAENPCGSGGIGKRTIFGRSDFISPPMDAEAARPPLAGEQRSTPRPLRTVSDRRQRIGWKITLMKSM